MKKFHEKFHLKLQIQHSPKLVLSGGHQIFLFHEFSLKFSLNFIKVHEFHEKKTTVKRS
jgi:hypothetical protein